MFLAYIVGVPWQDIAVDPSDLTQGFKNPAQMAAPLPGQNYNSWDLIVGTPIDEESAPPSPAGGMTVFVSGKSVVYAPPRDPHMIESVFPRTALLKNPVDPINGVPLAPPPAPGVVENPLPDPVNGHEWTPELLPGPNNAGVIDSGQQYDLQYACIFPLPVGRDCTDTTNNFACDCTDSRENPFPENDNPLCVTNPTDPTKGNTYQAYAKGYPGIREISLVEQLGTQGILGSICPATLDPTKSGELDYGYNATLNGIIDWIKPRLVPHCLPEPLTAASNGQVACAVLEATQNSPQGSAACTAACGATARAPATPDQYKAVEAKLEYQAPCMTLPDGAVAAVDTCCVCEIPQLTDTLGSGSWDALQCAGTPDEPLHACECTVASDQSLTLPDGTPASGWCYIDPTQNIGNPQLVANCPSGETREIRFVGAGTPTASTFTFLSCP